MHSKNEEGGDRRRALTGTRPRLGEEEKQRLSRCAAAGVARRRHLQPRAHRERKRVPAGPHSGGRGPPTQPGRRELTPRFATARAWYASTGTAQAQACPTSNVGEYFYLLAPDPAGSLNGRLALDPSGRPGPCCATSPTVRGDPTTTSSFISSTRPRRASTISRRSTARTSWPRTATGPCRMQWTMSRRRPWSCSRRAGTGSASTPMCGDRSTACLVAAQVSTGHRPGREVDEGDPRFMRNALAFPCAV